MGGWCSGVGNAYDLGMMIAPFPPDEDLRLVELRRLEILYSDPEEMFDRVTAELARIFEVPLAEITFMDGDRQSIKSFAADAIVPKAVTDIRIIPRVGSLCSHVIGSNAPMVIRDMTADPEFADSD